MPLAWFEVENYRSFRHRTRIEMRPLTLLFGYNSSGKSALLRTLPLIGISADDEFRVPLNLNTEAARQSSFSDLCCKLTSTPRIDLGLGFEATAAQPVSQIAIRLRDLSPTPTHVIESLRLGASDEQPLTLSWVPDDPFAPGGLRYSLDGEQANTETPIEFRGLLPTLSSTLPPRLQTFLRSYAQRLIALRGGMYWLQALRQAPERRARYADARRRIKPNGASALHMLAQDQLGDGQVLKRVSAWYERFTNHRLNVRKEAEFFSVVLSPIAQPAVQIPLIDTGEGMGQVLPVLVLGALAQCGRLQSDPILPIEHPELHLHPSAQEGLAIFFCDMVRERPEARVLVETHSENFLLGLQVAILEEWIKPQDLLVYFVRQLEDGSSVADPITFDKMARPEGQTWPPGVFNEDTELARRIIQKRREHAGKSS